MSRNTFIFVCSNSPLLGLSKKTTKKETGTGKQNLTFFFNFRKKEIKRKYLHEIYMTFPLKDFVMLISFQCLNIPWIITCIVLTLSFVHMLMKSK